MKIDKRKCPLLYDKISFSKLGLTHYSTVGRTPVSDDIMEANETILSGGLSNIMYLTKPIVKAFDFGPDETIQKLLSLRNEINSTSKCVIWRNDPIDGLPSSTTTCVYSFEKHENQTNFTILWQIVFDGHQKYTMHIAGVWHHDWEECNKFAIAGIGPGTEYDTKAFVNQAELIVQCEVFLQYAELETKILKQNTKDSIICKYHNKLPFPVTIIDSTWYTNLVKSDSFKVRGHFRLQPFGPLMAKRKLIWINEFTKEGYTREAKKLSHTQ